ncbi:MAG: immunoglobulin domain-containing protein [Candidatus Bipolaricaulota bacterium]|nr:immunoglobulin domain-containing protein [Candidatus Bipolaricaulota bacterium]
MQVVRATVAFCLVGIGVLLAGCRGTPPTLSAGPVSQTVCAGGSVTFTVKATGSSPLSYQWKKDGADISGATGASYTIPAATAAHAGSYTVVVSNKAGKATSAPATLTVNAPPQITAQPEPQSACPGASVLLTVSASGTPPLSYQWKKNGADVPGATTAVLTLSPFTEAHVGTYTVVVTNLCGSVTSAPAAVTLQVPPTLAVQPRAQTACAGQPATFEVSASGTAPLAYQWKKDGADIPGATAARYTIPAASSADAGTYTVTVTNPCGAVSSAGATLTVNTAPTITLHPVSQTASAGSAVTLSVIATGTPPLAYQWKKDGTDLPGATGELYTIPAVAAGDAGTYTVVVSNPCGAATSNPATLTVTSPPPVQTPSGPFATLNGRTLTREAFEGTRAEILAYYTRLYAQFGINIQVFLQGARGRMFELEIAATALSTLITRTLVEAEAERRGITVSPEEVEAEFERQYRAMLEAYGITEEFLEGYFAAQGGSLEAFKAQGRASVAEELLYEAVQRAVAGPIELGQAELEAYFEKNKARYSVEEQVRASHILVATREEAEEILKRLAAGEDFAELAKALSKDPGSAGQGGDLGWFGRGRMVAPFEEAAFALKVGETSGVVETQFGFHIIRVTDRREAHEPTLAEVADRVRADAEREEASKRFGAWLKAAREGARLTVSDPVLYAIYLKDRDLDGAIAALEKLQATDEKYLYFLIGQLYEEKMAALESDKEAAEALPEGPERAARLAALDQGIAAARQAALAAYKKALEILPDDEDVKERIAALEGGAAPR